MTPVALLVALFCCVLALASASSPQRYAITSYRDLLSDESRGGNPTYLARPAVDEERLWTSYEPSRDAASDQRPLPAKPQPAKIAIKKSKTKKKKNHQISPQQEEQQKMQIEQQQREEELLKVSASEVSSEKDLESAPTHHHGHDHHGWLDMGAYSGHHGAFGWYADFPVGGRRRRRRSFSA